MKVNYFFRTIVAIAMLFICWLPSFAHDFEVDGICYNKTSDNTVAVTYKGYSYYSYSNEYAGDIVIPSSVNYNGTTYSVTSIGNEAFRCCTSLTSVEIGNSVTSIGDYAFTSCSSLTSVVIPNSVTSIGNYVFRSCSGLTSIQIPNSVTSIGNEAFGSCTSLTSIEIPNSVTSIGDYAFGHCSSLTSIQIPNSITSIGDYAFYGCSSCTSVVIPNSVTSIGNEAFGRCSGLTSVVIGNSVTSIGDYAFAYCESLTSIEIPNSVTSIGDYAFKYCESLTSIEMPNSVTSIGSHAFYGCSSLTSIEIPNSVSSIGEGAFEDCIGLTSIKIGNSVTSIGNEAFISCLNLTSIVVDAGNTKYDSRNGCNAIIETATNTLIVGCQNTTIPDSVTSIGNYAFISCSSLTSIEIPDSVTSIGNYAFYGCSSLTSVEIPNSVTSIGYDAFGRCSGLTSVEIGNSVTSIGDDAFIFCSSLTSIKIPDSVTSIGNEAFGRCSELTSVVIGNSVISIGDYAFYGCSSLTSVEIPNSVISIGDYAFRSCSGLTSVEIGNSVTSIGSSAFSDCIGLTSIEIPNSVTSIGDCAFMHCKGLTSIEIGNSVISIGDCAFYNCKGLTKITCLATNPPAILSTTFLYYFVNLYVLAGCISAYQSANYWKNFNIKEMPTPSTSIALNMIGATLKVTETITLIATVLPENATDKSVEWSSSNEAVATVDENGVVTAITVGEATITATTNDGTNLSASCKVIVNPTLATSIALDKTEVELEATQTATLEATVLPELTTNKSVTWSSSNESIATVDENGVVTAIAVGEAIITVTTTDGSNLSATCKVTVVSTFVVSIEVTPNEVEAEENSEVQLSVIILPEDATYKSVEWSSSNDVIASVDANGLVTMHSAGEAIITATTTDGTNLSATCNVTIVPTFVVSIEVTPNSVEAEENSEVQLSVNILPENATYKSVEWSSSNDAIASVNANGLVTMHSAGEAIITATTTDGTNLSATCRINVYSGIDGVNGNDVIVATIGDNIVVKNAKLGSVVNVYSSNGALIKSMTATDGSVVIEAPIKGIYVVTIDGKSFKVMVK